jgi:pimeloyl-ACP methyl ester carboxylesterase
MLVGHSYGGMVITGAVAALLERYPQRVRGLVCGAAMVPLPGEGWGDSHSGPRPMTTRCRRHVPHPFGMYRVPLHYDGTPIEALPRLFIDCTSRPTRPSTR